MAKKRSKPAQASANIVSPDEKPVTDFVTPIEFERWLDKHHTDHNGLWIRFFKANSGCASITYAQALDFALSYGWIDGLVRAGDEVS